MPGAASALLAAVVASASASAAPDVTGSAGPVPRRFVVEPAGRGLQRLEVPPAFLSASAGGDLADLRLAGADGREVPYLLVPPPDPAPRLVPAARIRPIPRTKTESGDEVDLGEVRELAGIRLEYGPECLLFVKRVRVDGSADGRRWTTLAAGDTLYALDAGAGPACGVSGRLVRDTVRFAPARVRFVRAVLDDRGTPRLPPLRAASALLAGGAPAVGPRVPLRVEARPGEPGLSRSALVLSGPHLPVRAVHVTTATARVSRRARVLEQRLRGGALEPVELGSGLLVRADAGGVVAAALAIPVAEPEELELELVVEDGDNPPLAEVGAEAELAPLPAILFESPDGAPLEARLGDPALRPPRYDLEALRPGLGRLRPATARVRPAPPRAADAAAARAAPTGLPEGAPLDRRRFRWSRTVAPAPSGLAAVAIDAAILSRSPALADVRLVAPDGRQVPYLVERRDAPLAIPLAAPAPATGSSARALARPGTTVLAVALPEPALPASRLVLETSARVFRREVRVYAEQRQARTRDRTPIATATWAHADPARPAPALTLELPALEGERLLIAVDDGDNAPLPLETPRLLLPAYRLRFFHPGPELALVLGADVAPPRYDLALLAPRLRAAPARDVALGPPPPGGGGRAEEPGRAVFVVAVGMATVVLLAVVAALVARRGGPAA